MIIKLCDEFKKTLRELQDQQAGLLELAQKHGAGIREAWDALKEKYKGYNFQSATFGIDEDGEAILTLPFQEDKEG